MIVKKGDYTILEKGNGDKGGGSSGTDPEWSKGGGDGGAEFTNKVGKLDQLPTVDTNAKSGPTTARNLGSGSILKAKGTEVKPTKKSRIFSGNLPKPNWGSLTTAALNKSGNTLSDKAKNLIKNIAGKEPAVNWKKELKKIFDHTLSAKEWVLPNKRFVSSGTIVHGERNAGNDTLKTIVCAVDTSGSISNDQIMTFINEIMYLCKTFDADKTIIMYVSDTLHQPIDVIKRGKKPDFSLIQSTGGNACGFIPPFQYIEQNKIKPSLFIYLTDTGGEMPDPNKYGIKKYAKKCVWFICSPTMYNTPPFGKVIFVPVRAIK